MRAASDGAHDEPNGQEGDGQEAKTEGQVGKWNRTPEYEQTHESRCRLTKPA
jgi:hypothetical protein